ncbi:trigger factor [Caldanaerobacter subterraneus subsp. tengcongensis MB4]|uniref:Trigger factor n=1 Tax=Caldanaerobacter subterraneus subsp. tengcongensis (strain DSM 15242 / JCM 11007 / NBRC 100824 / MB4) TaxID=273068 RepID=TIG_CALS4|nr:trigger factor [Caldanaerobacter subterraneus]Q8RC26.1 RecName: Full=Trigger factor; Short=TF; AltName: Full=PPIase [Caldanaerobacter subterraneus subsp. tengcongensis MB4]AAM23893.1 FKBP-type peptidyl-prolyl cis-trans isomerase (trigger factor) [Caldanaerobacter subterraneus subsp. tengcongensis MB4]MCS3916601.1 trigger factor [Caldanaerobacter subterraneus subsp. tengcongensis MB4]
MGASLKKIEKSVATLELTIPKEKFEEGLDYAFKKNASKFNVPGFRKGKAPRFLVERYYGEGVLYEDAIEYVFHEAYQEALKTFNLEPVDYPDINILQIGKGKDLVLEATVAVMPEVELGEYKGIEIEKIEYDVYDGDVEYELEKLRQQNARIIPVEGRPAEQGDIAVIDFEGYIDDKPFEGGKGENYELELGSNTFVPGFEDQIISHNVGETFDVTVTFPEDYRVEELKGKTAVFKVTLKALNKKELPELDDEFAKDVSEFETLEELKQDIRKKLEEKNKREAENEMKEKAVMKVVENAKVDIPDVMVERQIDLSLRDLDYNLRLQGLDLNTYLSITGKTIQDLRKEMWEGALNRVKTQLVIDKIAKVENIEATEEELENKLKELAESYRVNLEEFKKSLTESQINGIKEDIAYYKTIDFIFNQCKIVSKEE